MKPVFWCPIRQTFTNVEFQLSNFWKRFLWEQKHSKGGGTNLSMEMLELYRFEVCNRELSQVTRWIYYLVFGYKKWWE